MSKPLRKRQAVAQTTERDPVDRLGKFISWTFVSGAWVALLLAVIAFVTYRPSLTAGFVYDARKEILEEGFITSFSNLPAVLSLKVLNLNLMLGSRPGQMLYLMLIAAVAGKDPFLYHLCSNLLHTGNVALLFLLLVRLSRAESASLRHASALKIQIAAATATLIFALHPIAVESVAEISYSSSLLVAFFTLVALHAAVSFRPDHFPNALLTGSLATFCALAAVTCKESGIATPLLLMAYCFFFRRNERKGPWMIFLGTPLAAASAFLTARFLFPPPATMETYYVGGSFAHVFVTQPYLWAFMLGKLLWPATLSADYTVEDMHGLTTPLVMLILAVTIAWQIWLARKSRLGGLGVAIYWLGLLAVSNFIPLLHPLADRYYYLPLAGLAMQITALLLLSLRWGRGFWLAVLPFLLITIPLSQLTSTRQRVFSDNIALWSDTVRASPASETAHYGLGMAYQDTGDPRALDASISEFRQAIELDPQDHEAFNNLGIALIQKGQIEDAITAFEQSLRLEPGDKAVLDNLARAKAMQPDGAKPER